MVMVNKPFSSQFFLLVIEGDITHDHLFLSDGEDRAFIQSMRDLQLLLSPLRTHLASAVDRQQQLWLWKWMM